MPAAAVTAKQRGAQRDRLRPITSTLPLPVESPRPCDKSCCDGEKEDAASGAALINGGGEVSGAQRSGALYFCALLAAKWLLQ